MKVKFFSAINNAKFMFTIPLFIAGYAMADMHKVHMTSHSAISEDTLYIKDVADAYLKVSVICFKIFTLRIFFNMHVYTFVMKLHKNVIYE